MWVGWRRLSTESAGVGEKRLWLTGLILPFPRSILSLSSQHLWAQCPQLKRVWTDYRLVWPHVSRVWGFSSFVVWRQRELDFLSAADAVASICTSVDASKFVLPPNIRSSVYRALSTRYLKTRRRVGPGELVGKAEVSGGETSTPGSSHQSLRCSAAIARTISLSIPSLTIWATVRDWSQLQ